MSSTAKGPFFDLAGDVRQRADIVEVISDHVQLRRSGSQLKGLCPFHSEKTPSFSVSPEKQVFHCFGCGASGDVFEFVMKQEGLPFQEALHRLANRYGVSIPESSGRSSGMADRLLGVNEEAAKFFSRQLQKAAAGSAVGRFLKERKISEESVRRFELGYAPDSWDSLLAEFRKKNVSEELLEKAGLIRKAAKTGKWIDQFRDRLIFPIYSLRGRVVGFAGRVLTDTDKFGPKYLNTPETPVYQKGKILYGMQGGRERIRAANFVILVEGYIDAIQMAQHGFENVAAVSGTAFTEAQAKTIRQWAEEVVVLFDSDQAGKSASLRSIHVLLEQGLNVRIGLMPPGEDPDSYCLKFGAEKMSALLRAAPNFAEFIIGYYAGQADLKTPQGKSRCVRNVLPYLKAIPDRIERGEYVELLAKTTGVEPGRLMRELGLNAGPVRTAPPKNGKDLRQKAREKWERTLVQIFLNHPDKFREYRDRFREEDFSEAFSKKVFHLISSRDEGEIRVSELLAELDDPALKEKFGRLVVEPEVLDDVDKTILDVARYLKRNRETRSRQKEKWKTAAEQADSENFYRYQDTYFKTIRGH